MFGPKGFWESSGNWAKPSHVETVLIVEVIVKGQGQIVT
jgi:hypothetical protein